MKVEIEIFLSPTQESSNPARPTLTQHDALTFNSIDRINKLVGYIVYLLCVNEKWLLFVCLIQIAVVVIWALIGDETYDRRELHEWNA
jgi:hypothetical protein